MAVEAFLAGRLRWPQIADVAEAVLQQHDGATPTTVDDVVDADATARRLANQIMERELVS